VRSSPNDSLTNTLRRSSEPGRDNLLRLVPSWRLLSRRACLGLHCVLDTNLKMIKASVFAFAFLCLLLTAPAQEIETENVPAEILEPVEQGQFARSYVLDGSINPFYLRGDFDGDGRPDYAVRIKAKAGSDAGIAIWLSSLHKFKIIGAGVRFKVSGTTVTSLEFLNTWQVFGKAAVERGVESGPSPQLKGDVILAGKSESASGLIYWNGKTFAWYQQGD